MRGYGYQTVKNPPNSKNVFLNMGAIFGIQILAILFSATVLAQAFDISGQDLTVTKLSPTAKMVGLRAAVR